jgi:hypothetical protein
MLPYAKSDSDYTAIVMKQYGINMVVLTPHNQINQIMLDAKTWTKKHQKKVFKDISKIVLKEDKFFERNPHLASTSNQRWDDYNCDCVILAILGNLAYGNNIEMLHPSQWDMFTKNSDPRFPLSQSVGNSTPTVVEGIPVAISNLH